jgi:hypothetical protein
MQIAALSLCQIPGMRNLASVVHLDCENSLIRAIDSAELCPSELVTLSKNRESAFSALIIPSTANSRT